MNISLEITGSDELANLIEFVQEGIGWRRFDRMRERYRGRFERSALKVLGTYPPARGLNKFRFATARSRRWYFANHDGKYQRTGALGKRWRARLSVTRAGFSVAVSNPSNIAQFVYEGEGLRQVPGHSDTGWLNVDDEFISLAADAERDFLIELDNAIAGEL
jgi:hypothetical protein